MIIKILNVLCWGLAEVFSKMIRYTVMHVQL